MVKSPLLKVRLVILNNEFNRKNDSVEFTQEHFALFDRSLFTFKQLKERYSEEQLNEIKQQYKHIWTDWKALQLATSEELHYPLIPKVESWTNGWNLRNHFWCSYRTSQRQGEATALAQLLNKQQLQVYLMWQHYKADETLVSRQDYNKRLLKALPAWAETTHFHYQIWTNESSEWAVHWWLQDFLTSPEKQHQLISSLSTASIQLGVVWRPEEVIERPLEQLTTAVLEELWPLYQAVAK